MTASATSAAPPFRKAHARWVVCAMLLFAATINYIDRQVIGILKPTLSAEFGWADERIYAGIVFSFTFAYAIASNHRRRLAAAIVPTPKAAKESA